jgi:hypothetical protein
MAVAEVWKPGMAGPVSLERLAAEVEDAAEAVAGALHVLRAAQYLVPSGQWAECARAGSYVHSALLSVQEAHEWLQRAQWALRQEEAANGHD